MSHKWSAWSQDDQETYEYRQEHPYPNREVTLELANPNHDEQGRFASAGQHIDIAPGQPVRVSGGQYVYVKPNGDGTHTLRNENGDEFASEHGEVIELIPGLKPVSLKPEVKPVTNKLVLQPEKKSKQQVELDLPQLPVTADLSKPFLPAKDVKEAIDFAKTLGVYAKYTRGNLELANQANQAMLTAKKADWGLPKIVTMVNRPKSLWGAQDVYHYSSAMSWQAKHEPYHQMQINTAPGRANDGDKQVTAGWWAQSNPMLHELGHAQHEKLDHDGYRTFSKVRLRLYGTEKEIASKVSRYGATTPCEFIPEYLAGTLAGKKYDADVDALFEKLTRKK